MIPKEWSFAFFKMNVGVNEKIVIRLAHTRERAVWGWMRVGGKI